ncbi:MAG: GlsB/YeaQ/YmgE family stress response membrane protein [Mycobacteriaceae bacterium]|nr:GlsB/YeaQ/YmgE family stress response membrane protein [Mycobacteriaceae bacterium]
MDAIAATEFLARSTTTTSVGLLGYLIIGGLAGWIASKIMDTDKQMGILLNIVVGVAGALIGGFLLSFWFNTAGGGIIFTFFTALLGSVILLWVIKLLRRA